MSQDAKKSKERPNSKKRNMSEKAPKKFSEEDLAVNVEAYQKLHGQVHQFAQKMDKNRQQIKNLKKEKAKPVESQKLRELNQKLQSADEESKSLKQKLQVVKKKWERLVDQDRLNMALAEVKLLNSEMKQLEDKKQDLNRILRSQKGKIEEIQEISKEQRQKEQLSAQQIQMRRENKTIQESLAALEKEHAKHHKLNIELRQKLKDRQKKISEKKQNQAQQANLQSLQQSIERKKQEKERLLREEERAKADEKIKKRSLQIELNSRLAQLRDRQKSRKVISLRLKELFKYQTAREKEVSNHSTSLLESDPNVRIVSKNGRMPPKFVKSEDKKYETRSVSVEGQKRSDLKPQFGVGDSDINDYPEDFD